MRSVWGDYEQGHADRRNLRIHMFAVPLFGIAFPATLLFLISGDYLLAGVSLFAAIGCVVLQGIGHSKEPIAPNPFGGPLDFLKRWFSEQYFRLPLFVMSGRWRRQYWTARRKSSAI